MKITRNNVEIELTEQEIEMAYREKERQYHGEDVKSQWTIVYEEECPCSDEDAMRIGERAMELMGDRGGYWDYYWGCFEDAIREYVDEGNL